MPRYQWHRISDFRGGRNATDDPLSLGDTQVVQMRNGDTYRTGLFRKRGGATAPAIGSAFTGVIGALIAHQPDNNPANAELWGADSAATPIIGRMAGGTTFASQTLTDNIAPATANVTMRGASYNGKLHLAYNSAVDRFHVYDPNLATPRVRRSGLATSSAPTVANTGAGTYAATLRYYRQRYRIKHGAIIDAQSEPSASVSFTPSGTGTHARITKAATISEQETHWVLEGSEDDVTFYELAETAVGTTTYDDNETPTAYSDGNDLSPVLGAYTPATSWKYVIAAFNRLLGMGSHESGGPQSRLWFTPSKGTADKGDDERVPDTLTVRNWIDLDEGKGGDGSGFAGPIYGAVYVFKYHAIKKIRPTGAATPVFDVIEISETRGAIEQECVAMGEDAAGRPAIFFLDSQVGPMIVGPVPPTAIGDHSVRDLWDSVNLAATIKVGQVIDYPAKGQVWFWWATGAGNEPTMLAIYTKATGGWAVFDTGGKIRTARAAVLFARTPGAAMSRDNVPYVAYASANNTLLRGDTTDLTDDGTTFQATVKTKPYAFNNGKPFRTSEPWIVAKVATGVTLTVTVDRDFGKETRSTTIDLTATADETGATRVWRQCKGLDVTDAKVVQYELGDGAAVANSWQLETIWVPVLAEEALP